MFSSLMVAKNQVSLLKLFTKLQFFQIAQEKKNQKIETLYT